MQDSAGSPEHCPPYRGDGRVNASNTCNKGDDAMRIPISLLVAATVLLVSLPRLVAEENLNNPAMDAQQETGNGGEVKEDLEQQAIDTLRKLGARCEVDATLPGRPVIAVDLDHSDVHGDNLKLLKLFPCLHTMKWREVWSIGQEDMKILGSLTQLRNLDIWAWRIQDDWLKHLEGLTNLESLTLYWGDTFTDEGLRHLRRLTALRSLNLHNGFNITDKGITHLRGLMNLRRLDLGGTEISNKALGYLKDLRSLEALSVRSCKIDDKGLGNIRKLARLRFLDLAHTQITDGGLEHLKYLTELQTLDLDSPAINGSGLVHLTGLRKLRSLSLGSIDSSALPHIEKMAHLRKISLSFAKMITDEHLKQLCKLSRLRYLGLDYMPSITDEGLGYLRHLSNLRELELGHIEHMTDKGLDSLKSLTNLQRVHLHRLETVTDSGLKQLKNLPKIECLSLHYMAASDQTLKHLGALTHLRELDLTQTNVSDAGLVYLKDFHELQVLNLSDTRVANRGLGHLRAMPNLKVIYVEDSDVTDAGVESFRRSRPKTKVIQFTVKRSVGVGGGGEVMPMSSPPLELLTRILAKSNDPAVQLDVLRGMHEALQGRRSATAPENWSEVYRKLAGSKDAEIREKVLQLSVIFGDPQALTALRQTAADPKADATARRHALQTLVEKRPPDLLPLLRKLVAERTVRSVALRGLASYSDPQTPSLILEQYTSFTDAEKADAIATLAARPAYALALLDAMEKGRVPRRDLSAFTVRQLLAFKDKELTERLTKVWGSIRPPSAEKATLLAKYKAMVPAAALKKADRKHGRLLFSRTCASCHTLFGEGGNIGPDLTGSQRTNPEYLLTKLIDPSAVVARDYQMTVITTQSGRTISGLVKEENDKTLTLQTQNEAVRLDKRDIAERQRSPQSMMPDGLLAMLSPAEVRDLIAYLSGAGQVPLPRITPGTRK
jgi:putative heme-binding domain-containing protein